MLLRNYVLVDWGARKVAVPDGYVLSLGRFRLRIGNRIARRIKRELGR